MSENAYHYLGMKYNQETEYKNKIRARDHYTCQSCGQPGREVDHIIPWAISRDSSETNLQVLCLACNLAERRERKDAAMPESEYWRYIANELQPC